VHVSFLLEVSSGGPFHATVEVGLEMGPAWASWCDNDGRRSDVEMILTGCKRLLDEEV